MRIKLFAATLLLASAGGAAAGLRYVDVNSTNAVPPYISWTTAATNIQDAVDAAVAGDEIVVTNGIYATGGRAMVGTMTNRVAVDKPLTLRSINGPQFTVIRGFQVPYNVNGEGAIRCVYLTNGASLSGFTLTNGATRVVYDWPTTAQPNDRPRESSGGGLWCESIDSVTVSNCIVAGNSAYYAGGGVYGGTLNNCILSGNSATAYGGGAYGSTLNDCALSGNSTAASSLGWTGGGGVAFGTLNNCVLTDNLALSLVVGGNNTYLLFGGRGGGALDCQLNNCALSGNSAYYGGGTFGAILNNCTLTGNSVSGANVRWVDRELGGLQELYPAGGGAYSSTALNCIVYFNTASPGANHDSYSSVLNFSCTTPLPTNGVGNITNEPAFVNPALGNYRLRADSPCIDAGTNLSASITNDLDGRPRPLDGNGDGVAASDMGAYEYRMPLLVWQESPNPTPPHADWATAAHTIQDAVDAAVAGDEIVVTNGTYATGGRVEYGVEYDFYTRVVVAKPLMLRSVNGPRFTIIEGYAYTSCVYLTNSASLSGFTLTDGGVWCESVSAVLSNCVIKSSGVSGGTLNNCTLTNNVHGAIGCVLNNSLLTDNDTAADSSTLNNCTLAGNVRGAVSSTLNNCIVYFNTLENYDSWSTLNYCCTMPPPTNGVGNIISDPQLASVSHLSASSPCRGAGSANYVSGSDIDGEAWTSPPSIGCDEFRIGAVTGALNVAISAPFTYVRVGTLLSLTSMIEGRTTASSWDFGDGITAGNQPYATHAWAAAGDYAVVLRAYNETQPGGISATVLIHVATQAIHYVAANSPSPVAPYASWATAATNIQDAVDAAADGGLVLVTNGIYASGGRTMIGSNRVAVLRRLALRSINGPEFTAIRGVKESPWVRCVYLADGARLCGFTLSDGFSFTGGGGVWCESSDVVVSNCVIAGNEARSGGGGAFGGTLYNCAIVGNVCRDLYGNHVSFGGGAYGSTLNNCLVASNLCTFNSIGSHTFTRGGGASSCTLNNCTLAGNSADPSNGPSDGGGAVNSTLNNCTLTGNSAGRGGGASECALNNCIVYSNTAPQGANYDSYSTLNYSCTTPLPTNGIGNITNAPLFMELASGNLRLQSNSPCINAGLNALVPAGPDLDGNPRIVGGTVDMGAYEYQSLSLLNFGLVANQLGFIVTGQSNWVIVLEASSDFTNWIPLTTNTLGGSPWPFSDPTPPSLPQRFYRARQF